MGLPPPPPLMTAGRKSLSLWIAGIVKSMKKRMNWTNRKKPKSLKKLKKRMRWMKRKKRMTGKALKRKRGSGCRRPRTRRRCRRARARASPSPRWCGGSRSPPPARGTTALRVRKQSMHHRRTRAAAAATRGRWSGRRRGTCSGTALRLSGGTCGDDAARPSARRARSRRSSPCSRGGGCSRA